MDVPIKTPPISLCPVPSPTHWTISCVHTASPGSVRGGRPSPPFPPLSSPLHLVSVSYSTFLTICLSYSNSQGFRECVEESRYLLPGKRISCCALHRLNVEFGFRKKQMKLLWRRMKDGFSSNSLLPSPSILQRKQ